jgi:excisionase family DNA binding protein
MDKKYITIKEAAKILGVSALTLRNWDNSGRFPAGRHPISNYRVYKIDDINELMNQMDKLVVGVRRSNKKTVKKLIVKHLD